MPNTKPSLDTVFCEAISFDDPVARAAYTKQCCGSNSELYQRVEALVAAHFKAGSFLAQPANAVDTAVHTPSTGYLRSDAATPKAGSTIGPYKLREILGEGGMGSVFVAEQEKPVRRKVALKIIKPGMGSREVISRFESERQALALMDHPNIARVLDAGTTDCGLPYFVMELVKGTPITEHCDTHKLGTRERLDLFLQVCQAIHHAHQKGIIHRDIKPSNVLVAVHDVTLVVKVIDFGVAKAMGQQLTDNTLYTAFSQMVGTPLYMSPEQAGQSSLDIDTRSDVYSLGVLLYELLTGNTPFDKDTLKQAGFDEMRRMIREVDPPKPSARVSTLNAEAQSTVAKQRQLEPRKLKQAFRGELDWIVMKAMEKDRNRRYESANSLAADVKRFLDDEEVHACPPSVVYRLQKFSRRHRGLVSTCLLIMASLMVGAGVASWQAIRAGKAEKLANRENEIARKNLETAMDAIEQLLIHVANPELIEIPGLQSTREKILQDSLRFYERLSFGAKFAPRIEIRAARVLQGLAELAKETQQFAKAIEAFAEARALADKLALFDPVREEYVALQAELNLVSGRLFMNAIVAPGSHEQANYFLQRAENLYQRLSQMVPENPSYVASQGEAMYLRATTYLKSRAPTDPEIVELANRAYELNDSTTDVLLLMARVKGPVDLKQADDFYRRAIATARAKPLDNRENRYALAWICFEVAGPLSKRYPDESESLLKESVALLAELMRTYPSVVLYRDFFRAPVRSLVSHSAGQGRRPQGVGWIDELLQKHPDLTKPEFLHEARAELLAADEDPNLKISSLTDSISKYPDQQAYLYLRGSCYAGLGLFNEAKADFRRSIRLQTDDASPHSKLTFARSLNNFAWLLIVLPDEKQREPDLAVEFATKAVQLSPANGDYLNTLGVAQYRNGNWKMAIECLEKSIKLREGMFSYSGFFLAMAHWQIDEKSVARTWYDQSDEWMAKNKPDDQELLRFRVEATELLRVKEELK